LTPCLPPEPLDVVVLLLDDMRFDQLPVLERTLSRLQAEAVTFDRAYVSTPMCCPERASFLSGGWYAHQTGVLTNETPTGGATRFEDARTLPTRLQEAGYHTVLLGKYLNEYDLLGDYVPPGWSTWEATFDSGGWRDFEVRVGSSTPDAPSVATVVPVDEYVTDWHTERALAAIDAAGASPLFLYVSFLAPHHPHIPEPGDAGAFADFVYRDRAYQENDVSDKPGWVRGLPRMTEVEREAADFANRERQETLLSVDRSIAAIVDHVRDRGRASRTLFVLTSDNGMLWGEHRIAGKGVAYEEAVRVPLLVAHPAFTPRKVDALVTMNLDVPATIQAAARLAVEGEGIDLADALCSGADPGRDAALLQGWPIDGPAWSALVTPGEKYIETVGGFREFYDLVADPFEERSQHGDPSRGPRIEDLSVRLAGLRGLAVDTADLPEAKAGQAYGAPLASWGGVAPLRWSVESGDPPGGVAVTSDGWVAGVPASPGRHTFRVRVTDSGVSPVTGASQSVVAPVTLVVLAAEPSACGRGAAGCGHGPSGAGATVAGTMAALAGWRRWRPPAGRGGVPGRRLSPSAQPHPHS